MFFCSKKYTTLHDISESNYELHQIRLFSFTQDYPFGMGFGRNLDLPW